MRASHGTQRVPGGFSPDGAERPPVLRDAQSARLTPNRFSDILSDMGYKTTATTCSVQLLALHNLPPATLALCQALRREAGRCWSDLLAAHRAARQQGIWLTDA